ncbi:MAG: LysM peptidoglycan-binding domain-containing M23 family metallopeptidase [Oscillospiraceae bacterium]
MPFNLHFLKRNNNGEKTADIKSSKDADTKHNKAEDKKINTQKEKLHYRFATRFQRSDNVAAIEGEFIPVRAMYNALGQFLYKVGFEGEYFLLSIKRGVKFAAKKSAVVFKYCGKRFFAFIKKVAASLLYDFNEPWQRMISGMRNIKLETKKLAQQAGKREAAKNGVAYFFSGIKANIHLLLPVLGYLLPIGACLVFVYTVNTMLEYNFALAVNSNGEQLGFVENQKVFEDAKAFVRGRIRTVKEGDEWSVDPEFTLAITDKAALSSAEFMADKLIETSSSDIQNATGIYVDGELLGVTTEGDLLQKTLDDIRTPYLQENNPNLRVEFVKDVTLLPGIYFTSSLTDASAITAKLTGEVEGQRIYSVQKGDSPSEIAQKNDIPLKDLYALNPKISENGYRMPIGDELLIAKSENFLQVKTIERVTRQVTVPHETIKTNSEDLQWGSKRVTVEGADGIDEHVVDVTRIDNIPISEEIITVTPIMAPITQEETVGIKNAFGGVAGEASTGDMIWPVPGYRRVSRGFSRYHRGVDIAASYGVPILAADNGIVQMAGSGRGTAYWSYGNFVQLSHSTGVVTLYGHCSSVAVRAGEYVSKGQVIAYIGSTGNSTGNHCHLETQIGGRPVDPYRFVKQPW